MFGARRYLPSMPSLLALEAVDRLGSASAAAQELSLTQGAISRQLQVIEAQMGAALIQRDGPRLRLTPAGQDYARAVRLALQSLAAASLTLRANPLGGSLNLAILPAFGMHWLAPRLADFTKNHPEVTLNLSTRLKPFDFASSNFDAAIHYGRQDWAGVDYLPLMEETLIPVAAPRRSPNRSRRRLIFSHILCCKLRGALAIGAAGSRITASPICARTPCCLTNSQP